MVTKISRNIREFKKLNIGCGKKIDPNYINLDMVKMPGVDVVHDLEIFPYPFADDSLEEIKAIDVLEHVNNIIGIMDELWRILQPGGKLFIRGPHAAYPLQAWRDPTHRRLFVPGTFDNWDPDTRDGKNYGFYFSKAKFKILEEREVNMGMEYILIKK